MQALLIRPWFIHMRVPPRPLECGTHVLLLGRSYGEKTTG